MTDPDLLLGVAALATLPSLPLLVSLVMNRRAHHEPLSLARLLVIAEELRQMSQSLTNLQLAVDRAVDVQMRATFKIDELRAAGQCDPALDQMTAALASVSAALNDAIKDPPATDPMSSSSPSSSSAS